MKENEQGADQQGSEREPVPEKGLEIEEGRADVGEAIAWRGDRLGEGHPNLRLARFWKKL